MNISCQSLLWYNTHHCGGLLALWRQVPVAEENLSQDGVVRLLGHWAFPPCVEGWHVPFYHLHHALFGFQLIRDTGDENISRHTTGSKVMTPTKQRSVHNAMDGILKQNVFLIFGNCWREFEVTYLTNKSGCAKKSAYISSKDLLSKINVGRTTWEREKKENSQQERDDERRADRRKAFTLVRSMPSRTWDSRCMITLLCSSTDSPWSSASSSWLSNWSDQSRRQTVKNTYTTDTGQPDILFSVTKENISQKGNRMCDVT